jgi:hypothetical protein
MLVLHQLLYVLFTLCGIFMHFLELTYYKDATLLVLIFCCFCILEKLYRKYSQNWTKQKPKFLFIRHEDGVQGGDGAKPGGGHTIGWCDPTHGHARPWCGPPRRPLTSPFCL